MLPRLWKHIDAHTNKKTFMHAVAEIWGLHSFKYLMIKIAYDMMFSGHRRDWRSSGERYARHVLAVAVIVMLYLGVRDHEVIIAALLHDLHEDHPQRYPLWAIESVFGPRVAWIVRCVTKPPYKRYGGKTIRHAKATRNKVLQGGRPAVLVKLADRLHNNMTLWGTPEKKLAKVRETFEYYWPIASKYGVLETEIFVALSQQVLSRTLYCVGPSEIGRDRN